MTDESSLPPLREVIARHGLAARKALGQHFLLDLNLTGRIARAAGGLGQGTTIEIGPGPGGLTRALLAEGAARVVAVEKDPRCLAALAEIAAAWPGRLEVIPGDALELDIAALGDAPRRVVANLPYNVGTPLLIGWLQRAAAFESFTLMFQKEVALRLAAAPGSRDYGRLSVLAQFICRVVPQFTVARTAFTPPPAVESMVVRLEPRSESVAPIRLETLERVTEAAFGQRRKMLRASLRPLGGAALLEKAGIDPTRRAEELSVAEFCALAGILESAR